MPYPLNANPATKVTPSVRMIRNRVATVHAITGPLVWVPRGTPGGLMNNAGPHALPATVKMVKLGMGGESGTPVPREGQIWPRGNAS